MFVREAKVFLFAERVTPEYTTQQRAIVARYYEAAARRLTPAGDLAPPGEHLLPLLLLRGAVDLLVRAVVAATEKDSTEGAIARLETIEALGRLRSAHNRLANDDTRRIDEALRSTDPLYFDSLSDADRAGLHELLIGEAAWLRGQIDLRSEANRRATRLGRLGAVVLVVGYVAYAALAKACAPQDLALGKPVTASSHQPGTPDPSGLVDGKVDGLYGLCTEVGGRDPWALIDLLRESNIHEIVVYNRGDRNFDDGLPYSLELSSDGRAFHEVARREKSFGDGGLMSPPWSAKVVGRARYVRIRANGYIALSEVKVF